MPRFVIMSHDHPFLHWDFLLEDGDACRTWRLLAEPAVASEVAAERIADHRLHYLDYEGPVSGNRGSVVRFDGGEFEWRRNTDTAVEVVLQGSRIDAGCTLERDRDGQWLVSFHARG